MEEEQATAGELMKLYIINFSFKLFTENIK